MKFEPVVMKRAGMLARSNLLMLLGVAVGGLGALCVTTPWVGRPALEAAAGKAVPRPSDGLSAQLKSLAVGLEDGSATMQAILDTTTLLVGCLGPSQSPEFAFSLSENGETFGHLIALVKQDGERWWEFQITIPALPRYEDMADETEVTIRCRGQQGAINAVTASADTHVHKSLTNVQLIGSSLLVTGGFLAVGMTKSIWCQNILRVEQGSDPDGVRWVSRYSDDDTRIGGLESQSGASLVSQFLYSL